MEPTSWTWRARLYDMCEASSLRRAAAKTRLFSNMHGSVLFVAAGTGADFPFFPREMDITAIDINDELLRRATRRRKMYRGTLKLVKADAHFLPFPSECFDSAVTSCTMCSVSDPIGALQEVRRVLRPHGRLFMFEHVRSSNPILGWVLDTMTLWTRRGGTEMNRDTLRNVAAAGFTINRVESVYLDIILSVHATALSPDTSTRSGSPAANLANAPLTGLAARQGRSS